MSDYDKVLKFWNMKNIDTDVKLAEVMNGNCISLAYHLVKMR